MKIRLTFWWTIPCGILSAELSFANMWPWKAGWACRKLLSLLAGKWVRSSLHDRTAVSVHLVTFKRIVLRFHLAFDGFSAQLRPFVCLLQPTRVMTDTVRTVEHVQKSRGRPIAGMLLSLGKVVSLKTALFLLVVIVCGTWILACMVSALVDRAMFT